MKRRFALLCVGSLLFSPSLARAETGVPYDTGPSCTSASPVLPPKLPANVPGIAILGTATEVSLVALDGTTIPVTLGSVGTDGYAIATWSSSLVAGTEYTFRWSDGCGDGHERTFVTTAAAALPTAAGTLSASPMSEIMPCDEAGRPMGIVWADVRLKPSADLAPFLPVAATDLVVEPEASISYGRPYGGSTGESVGALGQKCPFGPREFVVSARVRIPNGPTLTTDAISVSLPCPTTCSSKPIDTVDASAVGTGGSDAGTGASPEQESTVRACSTSRSGAGPATFVFAVLGLASLARASRRRR